MRRPSLLALALLLAAPVAFAAGKPTTLSSEDIATATRLRDQALQDDTAWQFTEGLTTEVGARLAGSPKDLEAREWTIAKFKALGFDRVWSEPVTFPKWVRRSESGAIVSPFPQPLATDRHRTSAARRPHYAPDRSGARAWTGCMNGSVKSIGVTAANGDRLDIPGELNFSRAHPFAQILAALRASDPRAGAAG